MEHFPDLYHSANRSSKAAQDNYFRTAIGETLFLVLPPILAALPLVEEVRGVGYAISLVGLVTISSVSHVMKFDQKWYRCRALAESIKTSSWRYIMRAEPFVDARSASIPESAFRLHLQAILNQNRELGSGILPTSNPRPQIPDGMRSVRSEPLQTRIEYYLENRIVDQRRWYAKKAVWNDKKQNAWFLISIGIYVVMAFLLFSNSFEINTDWQAISVFSILGASALGWARAKKFGELATSYTLTAHEIGIIQEKIIVVDGEEAFSDFVNEAELAFSREHTQWTARRT
jgi:hypothetical protein